MRTFHLAFPFVALFLLLTSCRDRPAANRLESPENFTHVQSEDAAMNAAIAEARSRVQEFVDALQAPKPTYHEFYVKKPYRTPDGGNEHMWIGEVTEKEGKYSGVIANDAFETKEVKFGQSVDFVLTEISDWKYQDDSKLVGGLTIRYFYNKMSAAEKEAFRKESGLIIE